MPGQQGFFSRLELTNTQPYAQCGTAPFVKLALMLRCCGFVPAQIGTSCWHCCSPVRPAREPKGPCGSRTGPTDI